MQCHQEMGDYCGDFEGDREQGCIKTLMCIQNSMCLDEMVPLGDHMENHFEELVTVVVVDVFESCPCVYIYSRLC